MNKKLFIVPLILMSASFVGCNNNNKVNVTFTGETDKVTFTGDNTATKGVNYSAIIKPKSASDHLQTSNFEVKVNNSTLSVGKWYYNANKLDIEGSAITGDIVITFKSIESDIKFDSKLNGLTIDLDTPAKKGVKLIATLKAINETKRLPNKHVPNTNSSNLKVTIGGVETENYTFDDTTGKLIIEADNVTGDVFVTATGIEQVCVTFSKYYYHNGTSDEGTIYKGDVSSSVNIYIDKKDCDGYDANKGTFAYAVSKLKLDNYYPRAVNHGDYDAETYSDGELKGKNKFYGATATELIGYDSKFSTNTDVHPNFVDHTFTIKLASKDATIDDESLTYKSTFSKKITLSAASIAEGKCLPRKENISLKYNRYGKDTTIPSNKFEYYYDTDINTAKISISEDNKEYVAGDITVQLYPVNFYTASFYDQEGKLVYTNNAVPSGTTVGQAFSLSSAEEKAKVADKFNHWKVFESEGKALSYNSPIDGAVTAQGEHNYIAVNDTVTTFENDSWTNFVQNIEDDYANFRTDPTNPEKAQGKLFVTKYGDLDSAIGISSALGKTRKVVFGSGLNSVEFEARVIDVVRDKITSDANNAKGLFTFEFTSSLISSVIYGSSNDWIFSDLPGTCENIYNAIPDTVLKGAIKSVDKYTIYDKRQWKNTKSMHLFPLSGFEAGLIDDASHKEGADEKAYYYYKSGAHSPVKDQAVWLRTRYYLKDGMDYIIDSEGKLGYQECKASAGLAPAFCM